MNCPKCNSPISVKQKRCDCCGLDIQIYSKIVKASNAYYNVGLAKAKVRDLTGAVVALKQSLDLNKGNINARNLLGLVYYEMGETVSALSEWVLSKHLQSKNNDADDYMAAIQQNPTKLDTINQAIKKYNSALISAKQGSGDLAIIQLKKVTSLNPKFIRAHQLLALLYMQAGEMDRAEKSLLKALKIDVNNTLTLKYLKEFGRTNVRADGSDINKETTTRNDSIIPISSYKEDKPNILAYVTLIVGVIIGIAVVYFLMVPTIKKSYNDKLLSQSNQNTETLNNKEAMISTLEDDKKKLQEQVDTLQKQIDGGVVDDTTTTDNSVVTTNADYTALLNAATLYIGNKKEEAGTKLVEVNSQNLKITGAIELYNAIKELTFEATSAALYEDGHDLYSKAKYEEAITTLMQVVQLDPENENALYFIGRSYHQLDQLDKAKEYYNQIINNFAGTRRAREAKTQLSKIE